MEAEPQRKKSNRVYGTQVKARAGWLKHFRLVRVTPWADFADISHAIFPFVALS